MIEGVGADLLEGEGWAHALRAVGIIALEGFVLGWLFDRIFSRLLERLS